MSYSINESMNDKGVCRIAPGTPGLLIIQKITYRAKLLKNIGFFFLSFFGLKTLNCFNSGGTRIVFFLPLAIIFFVGSTDKF